MGSESLIAPTKASGPQIGRDQITFRWPDPSHELQQVRLYQEIHRPRNGPDFTYDREESEWVLHFPLPNAARLEYLVELVHPDGRTEMTTDPRNPLGSPGAFGDKSVVELPGYATPEWMTTTAPPGTLRELAIPCRAAKTDLRTIIWQPAETANDEPLPLLVVHDGPEYMELSHLTRFLEAGVAAYALPRLRAALIAPADRNEIYSASAAYGRSLSEQIIPAVTRHAPTPPGRSSRIGMGASLGALSMLHAHRRGPATFGALYLQSGSFFRMRFDKQEMGFPRFDRISRFVGEVLTDGEWAHPLRVTMTCGTVEENLANNRAVAHALRKQSYDLRFVANPDGHNWVGWRDTFEPHLTELLTEVWG